MREKEGMRPEMPVFDDDSEEEAIRRGEGLAQALRELLQGFLFTYARGIQIMIY